MYLTGIVDVFTNNYHDGGTCRKNFQIGLAYTTREPIVIGIKGKKCDYEKK